MPPRTIYLAQMPIREQVACCEAFQRDLERIRALKVTYICPAVECQGVFPAGEENA